MTIKDRNLKPGTQLIAHYHKQPFYCVVVEGEGNKVRYKLSDGRDFKSPSAAGMAITGHACDGWVFWSLLQDAPAQTTETQNEASTSAADNAQVTDQPTAAAQEQTEAPATTANQAAQEPTPPAKKPFFRNPNQKGVSEGQARWYCQVCKESFFAPQGEIPLACPEGHKG